VCLIALIACAIEAQGQGKNLPNLDSPVPSWVVKARVKSETCLTDTNHRDPCATVRVKKMQFRIAWDKQTSAVTFLFTDDVHLITDRELGDGGGCRLVDQADQPYKLTCLFGAGLYAHVDGLRAGFVR